MLRKDQKAAADLTALTLVPFLEAGHGLILDRITGRR